MSVTTFPSPLPMMAAPTQVCSSRSVFVISTLFQLATKLPAKYSHFTVLLSLQKCSKFILFPQSRVTSSNTKGGLLPIPSFFKGAIVRVCSYLISFQGLFLFFQNISHIHFSPFSLPPYRPGPCFQCCSYSTASQWASHSQCPVHSSRLACSQSPLWAALSCSRTPGDSFPSLYCSKLTPTYSTSHCLFTECPLSSGQASLFTVPGM